MVRLSRSFTTIACALVLVVVGAIPSAAHSELIDVQPATDSVVAAGDLVTLSFSAVLLEIGAEVAVTDASGAVTSVPVGFPTTQSVEFTMPEIAGGAVSVAWRVVAEDGHPIEGVLTYVAEAPPSASAPASATPTPTTPTPTPTPSTAVATPSASAGAQDLGEDPAGPGVPIAVWIAVAAALVAAFSVTLAARKR